LKLFIFSNNGDREIKFFKLNLSHRGQQDYISFISFCLVPASIDQPKFFHGFQSYDGWVDFLPLHAENLEGVYFTAREFLIFSKNTDLSRFPG